MYVCVCFAVRDADVARCVEHGATSVEDVIDETLASTGCGTCSETLCARFAAHKLAQSDTSVLDSRIST